MRVGKPWSSSPYEIDNTVEPAQIVPVDQSPYRTNTIVMAQPKDNYVNLAKFVKLLLAGFEAKNSWGKNEAKDLINSSLLNYLQNEE